VFYLRNEEEPRATSMRFYAMDVRTAVAGSRWRFSYHR
jgi:hypothetical protein